MELKNHQQEAFEIIKKIWKSDIDKGILYFAHTLNEKQLGTLGNIYYGEFVSSCSYIYSKTVVLLERMELIVFKKNPFTPESLTSGCPFEVTEKCKKTSLEELERLIISASEMNEDPIIGKFNDVELKTSGEILYRKLFKGKIKQNSNQYLLLKALVGNNDKDIIMTIEDLKKNLVLSVDKASFLYKEKTYENLNQNLRDIKVPIRVRKHGKGYKLEISEMNP